MDGVRKIQGIQGKSGDQCAVFRPDGDCSLRITAFLSANIAQFWKAKRNVLRACDGVRSVGLERLEALAPKAEMSGCRRACRHFAPGWRELRYGCGFMV